MPPSTKQQVKPVPCVCGKKPKISQLVATCDIECLVCSFALYVRDRSRSVAIAAWNAGVAAAKEESKS